MGVFSNVSVGPREKRSHVGDPSPQISGLCLQMFLARRPRPVVSGAVHHDAQDALRRLPGGPPDEDGPERHGGAGDALEDGLPTRSDSGGGAEACADHAVHEGNTLPRLEFVVDEAQQCRFRISVVVSGAENNGSCPVDVGLRGVRCSDDFYYGTRTRGRSFGYEFGERRRRAALRMSRVDDEDGSVAVHVFCRNHAKKTAVSQPVNHRQGRAQFSYFHGCAGTFIIGRRRRSRFKT